MPLMRRMGDSWSVRATALPSRGMEVQGSYARVASPEQREGFGLDQRVAGWDLVPLCKPRDAERARELVEQRAPRHAGSPLRGRDVGGPA